MWKVETMKASECHVDFFFLLVGLQLLALLQIGYTLENLELEPKPGGLADDFSGF